MFYKANELHRSELRGIMMVKSFIPSLILERGPRGELDYFMIYSDASIEEFS